MQLPLIIFLIYLDLYEHKFKKIKVVRLRLKSLGDQAKCWHIMIVSELLEYPSFIYLFLFFFSFFLCFCLFVFVDLNLTYVNI
jgi:hypothetical protein